MFGDNLLADGIRFTKALVTNQYARLFPRTYLRMTRQTGRGSEQESLQDIAEYFWRCFCEYFNQMNVPMDEIPDFLRGKTVLEYGPGDIPAMALLMSAYGAERVICIDRFPMASLSDKNQAVLENIIKGLQGKQLDRINSAFQMLGSPYSSLRTDWFEYRVTKNGFSGLQDEVDLIISRAVLEHLNDLEGSFTDMYRAMRNGAIAIHQVDLKSHGLHCNNPLDFLTWPSSLWNLMYSYKGMPNRWRINRYRDIIKKYDYTVLKLQPTSLAETQHINVVRPRLATPFHSVSDEDISWLGFWLVMKKETILNQNN